MTFANPHKREKLSATLEHLAAEFIAREGNQTALVTVTGSKLSDSGRHIDILVTVLPEESENGAIKILSESKKGFTEYVDKHAKIGRMPSFDFKIDKGEKNRLRIEDII